MAVVLILIIGVAIVATCSLWIVFRGAPSPRDDHESRHPAVVAGCFNAGRSRGTRF